MADATATRLAIANKIIDKSNFNPQVETNNLSVFNEIQSYTWKTIIYDSIKNIGDGLGVFFKEPLVYGNGQRIISLGINSIQDFSGDPSTRFPTSHNVLSDTQTILKVKVRNYQRLTLTEKQWLPYFKDKEGLIQFSELYRKRFQDTFSLCYMSAFLRLFGVKNPNDQTTDYPLIGYFPAPTTPKSDKDSTDKWTFDKVIDRVKKVLNSNVKKPSDYGWTFTTSTIPAVNLVQFLASLVQHYTTQATTDANFGYIHTGPSSSTKYQYYNIETDSTTPVDFTPLTHIPKKEDLILVMSNQDRISYERQYQGGVYNLEKVLLPKFGKTIFLPFPAGTAYILTKDCIWINPQFQQHLTEFFANDLTTDLIGHDWFYINTFPQAFGFCVKLK